MIEYPEASREKAIREWLALRSVLVYARKRAKLTQLDVASAMGVSLSSVSYWERSERAPGTLFLLAWAAMLGLRVELQEEGAGDAVAAGE